MREIRLNGDCEVKVGTTSLGEEIEDGRRSQYLSRRQKLRLRTLRQ